MTYLYALTLVLLTDLFTKELAESFLESRVYEPLPFLKLFLIHNRGVAFGFLSEAPDVIRIPVLFMAPVVALIITYVYSSRAKDRAIQVLMGMIAGGALGNLYDRLFLGEVRDFIHLHVGDFYWPAFNFADASITTAIAVLLIRHIRN